MQEMLLIVPYGIETVLNDVRARSCNHLLIVPYGIETLLNQTVPKPHVSFNCTLWN